MAVPRRRTDWTARRAEVRSQHGLSRWERDTPAVTAQLRQEKDAEDAFNASLPGPTGRPTSAHERKTKRDAARAAAKRGPKNQKKAKQKPGSGGGVRGKTR